jgi:branched-chain amino acid transport system permease protein
MRAVGEDELLALAMGVDAGKIRGMAFGISGAVAGIAGAVLAGYLSFIDPGTFGLSESLFILTALLIGGRGNLLGPALGTALVIFLPEALRSISVDSAIAGNLQNILFALAVIALMRFRPKGLFGEVTFQ